MAVSQRPATTSATPTTSSVMPRPARRMRAAPSIGSVPRLPGVRVRDDDHRGPVGDDLRHALAELRAVEAHRDHGVRAHQDGVLDHAVERLTAGVLEQLRVFVDLAADEGPEAGGDVAGEAAAADDEPEDLAAGLR